jgi:hypothetical protein
MPTITLRPNGTNSSSFATVVGAATIHTALSDDSDSSRVDLNSFKSSFGDITNATLDVALTSFTIGENRVRALTPHLRGQNAYARFPVPLAADITVSFTGVGGSTMPRFPDDNSGGWQTLTGSTLEVAVGQATLDALNINVITSATRAPNGQAAITSLVEIYVDVLYATQPGAVPVAPIGTISTLTPTVVWTYQSGQDGGPQTHYHVKIFSAEQYTDAGFDPATSTAAWDSGDVASNVSQVDVDVDLPNSTQYRAFVRVAQTIVGQVQWSNWGPFSGFTVLAPTGGVIALADDSPEFTFTTEFWPVAHVNLGTYWADFSTYMVEAQIFRGRERFVDRFQPATATLIIDNRDGWADLAGTPTDIADAPMRPGREARVGIEGYWGTSERSIRWLWWGTIDACRPSYDPTLHDIVTAAGVCALGEIASTKLPVLGSPVGASETVPDRIHRILDAASQASNRRHLDASTTTVLATVLGSQVADELGRTADSANGFVFGDLTGGITYRDTDFMLYPTGTEADWIIGNIDAGDVCPGPWEPSFDRADLVTRALIGRTIDPPENPDINDDLDGQAVYGIQPFERTDLLNADPSGFPDMAFRWIDILGKDSMPRIESVTLSAATGRPASTLTWQDLVDTYATWSALDAAVDIWRDLSSVNLVAEVMSTAAPELPSRYRCRLKAYSGRQVFDRMMFATSVAHTVARDEWTLRIGLDVAEWAAT